MKYFILCPNDQRPFNWIFFSQKGDEPLHFRARYLAFRCQLCKKFDEDQAMSAGIDDDVVVKSRNDFFLTDDGLICVSLRFKEIVLSQDISGLRFVGIPSTDKFFIASPTVEMDTDAERAKMEFVEPKCRFCGRFGEVLLSPLIESIQKPTDPLVIFTPSIWNENHRNRVTWLYATQTVVDILKREKIRGFTAIKA